LIQNLGEPSLEWREGVLFLTSLVREQVFVYNKPVIEVKVGVVIEFSMFEVSS